jgi:hypothetical protein
LENKVSIRHEFFIHQNINIFFFMLNFHQLCLCFTKRFCFFLLQLNLLLFIKIWLDFLLNFSLNSEIIHITIQKACDLIKGLLSQILNVFIQTNSLLEV